MVTKEVEVIVEMSIANRLEAEEKENPVEEASSIDDEEERDVDYPYAEETYSDEEEIIESLKEKIKRWFK